MAKTSDIRARVSPSDKAAGEAILKQLDMNTSDALALFWRQLIIHRGLPFDVKIPNAETKAALREPRRQGKAYKSAADMRASILTDTE